MENDIKKKIETLLNDSTSSEKLIGNLNELREVLRLMEGLSVDVGGDVICISLALWTRLMNVLRSLSGQLFIIENSPAIDGEDWKKLSFAIKAAVKSGNEIKLTGVEGSLEKIPLILRDETGKEYKLTTDHDRQNLNELIQKSDVRIQPKTPHNGFYITFFSPGNQ